MYLVTVTEIAVVNSAHSIPLRAAWRDLDQPRWIVVVREMTAWCSCCWWCWWWWWWWCCRRSGYSPQPWLLAATIARIRVCVIVINCRSAAALQLTFCYHTLVFNAVLCILRSECIRLTRTSLYLFARYNLKAERIESKDVNWMERSIRRLTHAPETGSRNRRHNSTSDSGAIFSCMHDFYRQALPTGPEGS